jgi:signal transduction histidine kinase
MGRVADQRTSGQCISEVGDTDAVLLAEQAREAERRDLARELHDTVLQPIAALVTSFDSLRQQALAPGLVEAYLGAWKELAQEALDSLRDTLAGLRPHPHAALQLPDALARFVAPHLRGRGLRVTLESVGWPEDLPAHWTTDLYLAIREALTNVEKHAHATEVTLLLKAGAKHLWIIVADNGTGFDVSGAEAAAARARGSGFGLGGMHERVQRLGGSLTVYSTPGQGTQVHIRCPRPGGQGQQPKLVTASPAQWKAGVEHVH